MIEPAEVKRVVVRPPNWLGDAVLALPAIAALRQHFATAELTIAARPAVAALFREDTDAHPDRVIELPDPTRDAVAVLEAGRFDLGVLFPNSFRSAWQFQRAHIAERWGYPRAGRGLLLTRRSRRVKRPGAVHQADYYRDLVLGLGVTCDLNLVPRVAASASSVARAQALVDERRIPSDAPLVGFAPGAAYGQAKQWPPERVAEVMARVAREHHAWPIIVGASHDRDAARAIESWFRAHAGDVSSKVVNLAGRTSLGALAGLIARMTAFVANDSGAMHLAAALGRPVIAIFGPTNERATHPIGDYDLMIEPVFCRPCMLRDCPIDHRCMTRITVDAVYGALATRLAAAGH